MALITDPSLNNTTLPRTHRQRTISLDMDKPLGHSPEQSERHIGLRMNKTKTNINTSLRISYSRTFTRKQSSKEQENVSELKALFTSVSYLIEVWQLCGGCGANGTSHSILQHISFSLSKSHIHTNTINVCAHHCRRHTKTG